MVKIVPSFFSLCVVLKDADSETPVHQAAHPPNAGNHLNSTCYQAASTVPFPFPGPQVHQFPDSLSRARAVMLFNTAAVFCITRETEKARKALQEVSPMCVVYLPVTIGAGEGGQILKCPYFRVPTRGVPYVIPWLLPPCYPSLCVSSCAVSEAVR